MPTTDCTLKILKGPDAGQEFHCAATETILGRSPRSAIRLAAPSVSYEHAMLTRNGDLFFIENLSANGTFLNNEKLPAKTRLRTRDQIRLGDDTILRVESLPAAAAAGASRRWLLLLFVLMLVALLVVVILDPFSGGSDLKVDDAYLTLQNWTQQQAATGKLPRNTSDLLQEAWRLEAAHDRENAAKAWSRLRILLSNADDTFQANARDHKNALARLLSPRKNAAPPSDEELSAALVQFTAMMERRK